MAFIILFYITEGGLVRNGSYGPGLESLPLSEYDLGVFMRLILIISRKIEVDIRFLVALETQEGLKRNVIPLLGQGLTANRTQLVRHIAATASDKGLYRLRIKI